MKVQLDLERCVGHGRCYGLAPEIFGEDDEGHAVLLVPTALTPGQGEAARLAADNCPEEAISLDG